MKIKKTVVTTTSKAAKAAKATKPAKAITSARQESVSTSAGKAKPSAPAPADDKPSINKGKSGMRVMAFQDHTYAINDQPNRRFTDGELARLWCEEFPNSRAVKAGRITADMVRAVRHLYNNGTGGHGTVGVTHDSKPYVIENGKRVVSTYTRTRKAEAPAAPVVKAEAPAKVKATAPVVSGKKGKKVVVNRRAA